jgi:hypothetical protein
MTAKTTHIIPKEGGWVVRREGERRVSPSRVKKADVFVVKQGDEWAVKKPHSERASAVLPTQAAAIERARDLAGSGEIHVQGRASKRFFSVYPTQKEAIDAAREIVRQSRAGQIVIHGRDGSIRWRDVRGLPIVQTPPLKSDLGTKAIERAVSTVIRERLEEK